MSYVCSGATTQISWNQSHGPTQHWDSRPILWTSLRFFGIIVYCVRSSKSPPNLSSISVVLLLGHSISLFVVFCGILNCPRAVTPPCCYSKQVQTQIIYTHYSWPGSAAKLCFCRTKDKYIKRKRLRCSGPLTVCCPMLGHPLVSPAPCKVNARPLVTIINEYSGRVYAWRIFASLRLF